MGILEWVWLVLYNYFTWESFTFCEGLYYRLFGVGCRCSAWYAMAISLRSNNVGKDSLFVCLFFCCYDVGFSIYTHFCWLVWSLFAFVLSSSFWSYLDESCNNVCITYRVWIWYWRWNVWLHLMKRMGGWHSDVASRFSGQLGFAFILACLPFRKLLSSLQSELASRNRARRPLRNTLPNAFNKSIRGVLYCFPAASASYASVISMQVHLTLLCFVDDAEVFS